MPATKLTSNVDPVVPDQAGRLMPVDPLGANAPVEEVVRRRAYEIYQQRGREDGHAIQHWLQAESEVQCASKAKR
jgi:Protein of unknown function (DUF2934)